jgi:hypothetical protein
MQRTSRACATPCSGLHQRPEQRPRAKPEAREMRTAAEGRSRGGPELDLELAGRRRRGPRRRGGLRWRDRLGVVTPFGVHGRPGRGTPPEERATVPEPVRTPCLAPETVRHRRPLEREARRGDWRVRERKGAASGRPHALTPSPCRSVRPPPQNPTELLDAGGILRDLPLLHDACSTVGNQRARR